MSQLFRTDDRLKELKHQLEGSRLTYYLLILLAGWILLFPTPTQSARIFLDVLALVFWIYPMTKLLEKTQNLSQKISKEEAGLEAERRIAQSIKDTFKSHSVKVYARLDDNCLMAGNNKDLDVVAIFPHGERFAISIKRRSKAKKVYIHRDGQLRLFRLDGKQIPFKRCPARELIEQEKWLRKNRRNLLRTPGSTMIMPSIRVLVFATPTVVGKQDPNQYVSINEQQFVKIQRGKDWVYLLQEEQLCDFMAAILKLKRRSA